jgi:hypothetical protein
MRRLLAVLALAVGSAFAQQPPTVEQLQEQLENVAMQRNLLENQVIALGRALKDATKKAEACKPEVKPEKK